MKNEFHASEKDLDLLTEETEKMKNPSTLSQEEINSLMHH